MRTGRDTGGAPSRRAAMLGACAAALGLGVAVNDDVGGNLIDSQRQPIDALLAPADGCGRPGAVIHPLR